MADLPSTAASVDTNYQEQAGRAFPDLARWLAFPEPLVRQWFDEGRRL